MHICIYAPTECCTKIGVNDELNRGKLSYTLWVIWVTNPYELPIEMNICWILQHREHWEWCIGKDKSENLLITRGGWNTMEWDHGWIMSVQCLDHTPQAQWALQKQGGCCACSIGRDIVYEAWDDGQVWWGRQWGTSHQNLIFVVISLYFYLVWKYSIFLIYCYM